MNGWIKFHRKIWQSESPLFKGKNKTERIIVWMWMLSYSNENGLVKFGRHQVANETGLSDQQVKRIVSSWDAKATNEVTIKATNQYTELLILNWHKHQDKATKQATNDVSGKRPASDQQATTNKNREYKNKEINNIVETQRVFDLYISCFNKNPNTYKLTDKRKLKIKSRLKDAGIQMLEEAIKKTSRSSFHMGDNDRGWCADLDFIIRSYEQVEKLSQIPPDKFEKEKINEDNLAKFAKGET